MTPLIHRILRPLSSAGVQDAVLNLHHLPHTLTSLLGDGSALGMRVRYSWEVPVLGSAGGPRRAIPLLANPESRGTDPGTFLILNGDTLTDVTSRPCSMTIAARARWSRWPSCRTPNQRSTAAWASEPTGRSPAGSRADHASPSYHFIGVQVAEPAAFASVPADTPSEVAHAVSRAGRGAPRFGAGVQDAGELHGHRYAV